jgi:CubicO group peptidase (beta-lactamase class C family)
MRFRSLLLILALVALPTGVLPQGLPTAPASEVGLSREGLARLDAFANRLVKGGEIAGAVLLLARRGRVAHLESYGYADLESEKAMPEDAIFRICSMSKPIVSVAAMMLYEEGHFLLDDPVARFLPEFEKPQVIVPVGESYGLVPAENPITIRHLLTHTSGISYRFFGLPIIADLYAEAGITDGLSETDLDLAENVRRIASQPLLHEPGERFSYGLNTDVLGRLVEVVSGVSLGEFLEQRVFSPLRMGDSGFRVPEEKLGRVPAIYRSDRGEALERLPEGIHEEDHVVFSPGYPYRGPRRYESGGGGLVSTASDYARFAQMLLNGGELEGARLLSRKTVELMTADHLLGRPGSEDNGFGLGVSVAHAPGQSGEIVSEGTWGWSGFYTTNFWIDPEEELIGVVLTQTYPFNGGRVLDRLRTVAYTAIAD